MQNISNVTFLPWSSWLERDSEHGRREKRSHHLDHDIWKGYYIRCEDILWGIFLRASSCALGVRSSASSSWKLKAVLFLLLFGNTTSHQFFCVGVKAVVLDSFYMVAIRVFFSFHKNLFFLIKRMSSRINSMERIWCCLRHMMIHSWYGVFNFN